MDALVTGGTGFVGANLVRHFRGQTDWAVSVIDDWNGLTPPRDVGTEKPTG